MARDAGNPEIEAAVLALDAVKQALDGKPPEKVIIVPQRIVNVVARRAASPSRRCSARLAVLAALTAGCFQPMYAEHADGSPALRDKLMGVELPPIDKPNGSPDARLGVEVRNALAFKLYGGADRHAADASA